MKNIICLLVLFIGISATGTTFAQERRSAAKQLSAEERANKRAELLKSKLVLTDDQTARVKAAALKAEQERSNDREKAMATRQTFEKELGEILNPEQMEKYEAMKDQRRSEVKKKMEERRATEKINASEKEEDGTDK